MFLRNLARNSGPVCRLVTAAVCAGVACRLEAATRHEDAAQGAPFVFALIGLSAAASALSVWLVRRASDTGPRSAVVPANGSQPGSRGMSPGLPDCLNESSVRRNSAPEHTQGAGTPPPLRWV